MRLFLLALTGLFVLLPSLLILFAPGRAMAVRALWALAAFLAPLLTYGITMFFPMLTNNNPDAAQWERFFGLLLSGSGFFLPWVFFALFLHLRPR
jgi:hypothetical protein